MLPDLLLAAAGRGAALRTLARARVGLRALAVGRQAAPVAQALVRADLHQPLDVLRASPAADRPPRAGRRPSRAACEPRPRSGP